MKTKADEKKHPDDWLWCLHCQRFLQVSDLVEDWLGEQEACPFCGASGIGIDLFDWDGWKQLYPRQLSHWPRSIAELTRGLRHTLRRAAA